MNIVDLTQFLAETKVVAVIRKAPIDVLGDVVEALVAGGVRCIEITMDSPSAVSGITTIREKYGEQVAIGAGTILNTGQLHEAVEAGAEFLVCPHFDAYLVEQAMTRGAAIIPGVLTPTEVQAALSVGVDVMKLFPAGTMGPSYIQHLFGPFGNLNLMVTGGISEQNAAQFLQAGALAVGMGSALFPRADVEARNWANIASRVRRLLAALTEQI